jgi:hypothetical protein
MGDEDLAIAALLHDSVEDQGGKGYGRVRRRYLSYFCGIYRKMVFQNPVHLAE